MWRTATHSELHKTSHHMINSMTAETQHTTCYNSQPTVNNTQHELPIHNSAQHVLQQPTVTQQHTTCVTTADCYTTAHNICYNSRLLHNSTTCITTAHNMCYNSRPTTCATQQHTTCATTDGPKHVLQQPTHNSTQQPTHTNMCYNSRSTTCATTANPTIAHNMHYNI